MIYLGFDPGKTGAMVALDEEGRLLQFSRFPLIAAGKKKELHIYEMAAWVGELDFDHGRMTRATIEKVHAMPGQGVTSMFSFGRSLGIIEGIIAGKGIPRTYAAPRTWQATMLAGKPKGKDSKHSAALAAVELWPELSKLMQVKANWGIADAALIAEYGRRQWA